jgi:hypothetical protein
MVNLRRFNDGGSYRLDGLHVVLLVIPLHKFVQRPYDLLVPELGVSVKELFPLIWFCLLVHLN